MSEAISAKPIYSVGTVVQYRDRERRLQVGEVIRIEASWTRRDAPLIVYSLRHPTYRGRNFYTTDENIDCAMEYKPR